MEFSLALGQVGSLSPGNFGISFLSHFFDECLDDLCLIALYFGSFVFAPTLVIVERAPFGTSNTSKALDQKRHDQKVPTSRKRFSAARIYCINIECQNCTPSHLVRKIPKTGVNLSNFERVLLILVLLRGKVDSFTSLLWLEVFFAPGFGDHVRIGNKQVTNWKQPKFLTSSRQTWAPSLSNSENESEKAWEIA